MSYSEYFGIFNMIVYTVNVAALLVTLDEKKSKKDQSTVDKSVSFSPYTRWQASLMIFLGLATPYLNLLFVWTSIKILRKPAKKLWDKLRAKVSIWRD
jgi:hypothetical protein